MLQHGMRSLEPALDPFQDGQWSPLLINSREISHLTRPLVNSGQRIKLTMSLTGEFLDARHLLLGLSKASLS